MARAIWSGAISFGLVNVPVKAYTAVRDHKVHFHRIEKGTGARVRNQQVSEKSGKEVESGDVELGYELDKGTYVTFDPGEVDELRPQSTRSIDVSDFVPLVDIDPVFYEHTYWLAPDGEAGERAYGLLLAAMEDAQRVGIGTVVMRTKQYLTAIRPLDGALAMSTMRFADEVVDRDSIDAIPAKAPKVGAKEKKLAAQIVDALASDWDPDRYHDTFTEELRDLIERKSKGEEVVVEAPPEQKEGSNVVDLMAVLQASVDQARGKRSGSSRSTRASSSGSGSSSKGRSGTKKAVAKKASSKRSSSSTSKSSASKRSTKKAAKKAPAKKSASREKKSA